MWTQEHGTQADQEYTSQLRFAMKLTATVSNDHARQELARSLTATAGPRKRARWPRLMPHAAPTAHLDTQPCMECWHGAAERLHAYPRKRTLRAEARSAIRRIEYKPKLISRMKAAKQAGTLIQRETWLALGCDRRRRSQLHWRKIEWNLENEVGLRLTLKTCSNALRSCPKQDYLRKCLRTSHPQSWKTASPRCAQ